MAWSNKKRVGSFGSELIVEVVLNSQSGNSSNVTVRIRLRNGGNSTAFDNNGTSWNISGGAGSASGSDTFSIGAGSTGTLASRSFNVSHNSDGNKTISVTVNVGNTSTTTFGTPGSLTVSGIKLPRIAQVPSKPSKVSLSNITANSVRATWSAPANNGAAIDDYQVRAERGGSAVDVQNTGTSRSATLRGLDPNTQYGVRFRARNEVGWGPYSDFEYFTTKADAPTAPNNVDVTRVNDGRQTVTWSRRASSEAPYVSQRVQRQHYTGTAWSAFTNVSGSLSGTATSFTDSSTSPNGQYRYRVQATNASGSSVSAASGSVRTTPAAPTIGTARKLASGDIEVTYTPTTPYGDHLKHELQDNPSGAGWVTVATVVGSGPLKHPSPDPTKTHTYRVRAVDTFSSPNLASAWSDLSNVVQLLAPPLAPSLVGPSGAVDRDQPVPLEYRHNPVDTTEQTAGQIRWRPAGGSWTTVNTGTDPFYELPAPGTSGTFEWQARTRGEHATYSPWSPTWSFNAVSRPEVVIQSPEETTDQSQVEVVWGYQNADSSAQSRWEAQLLDEEDNVLATGSGSGTASSFLFQTVLEDGAEYTVKVRARASSGLWSEWDTATFLADFPLPYPIEVFPDWDTETGSVSITFQVDDSDGTELAPDSVDVQRDDGDGWVTIATGLDPETSIVDYIPRLGEVRYRAISRTDLPTARTGPETVIEWVHGHDPVFVNGGPDFETVCSAIGHEITTSPGIEQDTQEWAGWEKPTAVFGTGQTDGLAFQGNIFDHINDGRSTENEWRDLLLERGIVCYRDCRGRKMFGLLGLNFATASGVTRLSLTVTETHHVEGARDVLPVPDEED